MEALNEASKEPIAVGLRDKGKKTNSKEQHRIASMLERDLYFFDSKSHPLGASALSLKETPWRKLWRSRKKAA